MWFFLRSSAYWSTAAIIFTSLVNFFQFCMALCHLIKGCSVYVNIGFEESTERLLGWVGLEVKVKELFRVLVCPFGIELGNLSFGWIVICDSIISITF